MQMQIGIIGLGRIGGNTSRRLMKAGHHCVVFDANAKPREALAKEGATAVRSLEDVVKALGEKTTLSSMAVTPFTKTTSAAPKNWPASAFATSIAARPAASGVSSAATA
jgi:6-phosphogluconate dehydrogenase (decarboxylating)